MGGFTAAIQNFGIGRLAAVLGVAAGVAAVLVAVMLRVGQAPDALLYSNLDLREAAEITTALEQAGIKHSTRGDGSTVMVNRDEVGEARLLLAGQGLVTSGSVGYELFDNQSVLGQTEFQQQLNEQRALQGELARTIMSMRGVTAARVHITRPQRELFQSQAPEPSAAVVVGVGGRDLTGDQVRAIRNVVASSVPNLKPERVTVVDENNRTLAAGAEGEGFTGAFAEEAKASTEAQMQARIKDIVEGVVGIGSARVQVTAEIDHTRSTTQEQRFDPDGQVVRSTSTNGSNVQETTGMNDGAVTAANNIPGGEGANQLPLGSTSTDNTETTNYEISNTTTTTVREPGEVKRLAIAVAVDGVWTPGADGAEPTYEPRSAEEMAQITALVRSAVGFNEERGDSVEVVNVRFNRDTPEIGGTEASAGFLNLTTPDMMRMVELGVLLLTGLLMIFFVVRPLLKTANTPRPAAPEATMLQTTMVGPNGQQVMAGPDGTPLLAAPGSDMDQRIDIARIEGQVKASSIRRVADFVEKHPDESVAIIRTWLQEG